tara:strand:- start:424 stop:1365 length:942 start_codon:yes stop_codon:yes gene_type:complete
MYDLNKIINNHSSIYINGKTNTKKTTTVLNFLNNNEELYNYNYISLQQLRKEEDFKNLLNNQNIMLLLNKNLKKKVIIIDNIDYLQTTDKKILTHIIKYIKKTNNQNYTFIFIGTNNKDKKVLELMDVISCKLDFNNNNNNLFYDKNIKEIVHDFLNNEKKNISSINDKTIISLIYHENIINYINNDIIYYENFLNNMCIGDYYDRISFQKQLWQFNEMTFFIKVLYNYLNYKKNKFNNINNNNEVIFTKILTKYSNEYSNLNFIISLCNKLNCLKEDLYNILVYQNNKSNFLNKYKDLITNLEKSRAIKILQ